MMHDDIDDLDPHFGKVCQSCRKPVCPGCGGCHDCQRDWPGQRLDARLLSQDEIRRLTPADLGRLDIRGKVQ